MVKKTNTKSHKKNLKIAAVTAGAALLVTVGVFAYRSTHKESPDVAQGEVTDDKGKTDGSKSSTATGSGSSSAPMTADNQETPAATQTSSLPTPVLAKSSGNNGSIPSGVLVNFTCESTPGYFCEVKLEKPGAGAVVLEKKQLTGERGQSFASWNWESVSGSWSVTAVLSNSSGQSKSSAVQTLEVR